MLVRFVQGRGSYVYGLWLNRHLDKSAWEKVFWLLESTCTEATKEVHGFFLGPKIDMISPWCTSVLEIIRRMNIDSVVRIERFREMKHRESPTIHFLRRAISA